MKGDNDSNHTGLRGWKALLVIVGSGILVSCLSVGLVIALLNAVLGGGSSPEENSSVAQSRKPRETTAPGVLNLCELVEGQSLASAAPYNRVDNGKDYSDTAEDAPGKKPRTVSDDCSWKVPSASGGNWMFDLTYVAYMDATKDRDKIADKEFVDRIENERQSYTSVESDGPVERFEGDAEYFYGTTDSESYAYSLTRKVKSGVYRIKFEKSGKASEETEQDFSTQANLVVPYLDTAFEHQIPD